MMVSQYDYGYNLQVALWTNGEPVTITAAEIVSENFTTTCTFSGNVVTIPVTTSMTERFGHFPAELRVTDSTGQVSSKNFDWFVERSPLAVKSTQTYSGDVVEFTAKSVPLSSVVVTMEPIQSGSGDPSPTNVRPITGRTGASVLVNSEHSETGATTYPITFTSAGTVYAGTVDLVSGLLTVTHGYLDDWTNVAATWSTANGGMVNMATSGWDYPMASGSWFEDASTLCSILQKSNGVITGTPTIRFGNNNGNVYCYGLSDLGIASAADFRTWAADNGLAITYPLATPLTYNLTPTQVMSLLGENVVWSPDGEILVVVPEYY